jgi:hypothetical protein
MHWEESGEISNQFSTRVTTSITHHDPNNLLLQPVNL